jgi:hypothetical protein
MPLTPRQSTTTQIANRLLWGKSSLARYLDSLPMVYFGQQELTGTTIRARVGDGFNTAYDGTYSNVTLGEDGVGNIQYAAKYVPASNSFGNIYSAALNSFIDWDAGTMNIFIRPRNTGVWSDAATGRIARIYSDASNRMSFVKTSVAGRLDMTAVIGGEVSEHRILGITTADYMMLTIAWDSAGVHFYQDAQLLELESPRGNGAGALDSTRCLLGADDTGTPTEIWDGNMAYFGLANRALTPTEILNIYQKSKI